MNNDPHDSKAIANKPETELGLKGQGSGAPSEVYGSVFAEWNERASVRSAGERDMPFSSDKLFFSPQYSTLFLDGSVLAAPKAIRERLLVSQLYVYLRFTVWLELGPVNEVSNLLRQPDFLPWLPKKMKQDAHKVYTDEAYHATFSADLVSEVAEYTGIPSLNVHPAFLKSLDRLLTSEEQEFHALIKLFFVIISETLITGTLAGVPKDDQVQEKIRFFVDLHRVDEGRHHRYFKELFGLVWPRLPVHMKRKIGTLLPEMILAFLQPDGDALRTILADYPEIFPQPQSIVNGLLHRPDVMEGIHNSARHTLNMLSEASVFSDVAVVTAFKARHFRI